MSLTIKATYARITGADPDEVRPGEARNGAVHIGALMLTKTADALIDPKLVLSWLLTALGAPGAMIGALVPVREAGALMPQLMLARWVEASSQRKWFWAAGSAVQGLAALGIAAAALLFSGALAGGIIVACLAVLAVARSQDWTSPYLLESDLLFPVVHPMTSKSGASSSTALAIPSKGAAKKVCVSHVTPSTSRSVAAIWRSSRSASPRSLSTIRRG